MNGKHRIAIVLLGIVVCMNLSAHVKDGVWQVYYAADPPVIDGDMDKLYWSASTERVVVLNRDDAAPPDSYLDLFAAARLLWDYENLYVFVKVVDDEISSSSSNSYENDSVEYFFDGDNSKVVEAFDGVDDVQVRIEYQDTDASGVDNCPDGTVFAVADWENPDGDAYGYIIEAAFPLANIEVDSEAGSVFGFEIQINDRDNEARENMFRWWGDSNDAWHWAHIWGEAELTFFTADDASSVLGTSEAPEIDGIMDAVWADESYVIESCTYVFTNDDVVDGSYTEIEDWRDLQMEFRMMWDSDFFFLWIEVIDDEISVSGANAWENDSVELYFDGDNSKGDVFDGVDDVQLRYVWGEASGGTENNVFSWGELEGGFGYVLELAIPFADLNIIQDPDLEIGFEVQVNDRDNEIRENMIRWWGSDNMTWREPWRFGTVVLMSWCCDPPWLLLDTLDWPDCREVFAPGDTLKVSWMTNSVNYVEIYISFDGGLNWEPANVIQSPDPGPRRLLISDHPSDNCLIRIQDAGHPGNYDISDPPFSISTGSGIAEKPVQPLAFGLGSNYPNPFNPSTTVSYTLDRSGPARLTVTDVLGKEVCVLWQGFKSAGAHEVRFDASELESGVYFVRLESVSGVKAGKIVLLK
ncbi:T9SS type A sorting domain-containing protein [bacterium]|nr:T9SS type A sorting domain-containing protein [bacterium]